ncbi:MAG: GIY-YIG nuclease family protein [Patescibacteria group bacterium]
MYYVYILQSVNFLKQRYVGYSVNLKKRLKDHNSGYSKHTDKFRPWILLSYFAFNSKLTAKRFEYYLKTGSGRAFIKNHLV